MTLLFGPDEMRNIKLGVLDVRVLMEAQYVCQLLVAAEKKSVFFLAVLTPLIKSHIILSMFS